jgi:hypothetical protein
MRARLGGPSLHKAARLSFPVKPGRLLSNRTTEVAGNICALHAAAIANRISAGSDFEPVFFMMAAR